MGRERIPFLDIKGLQGLTTKSTQENLQAQQLRIAQNCDFFEEYGSVAKIRGSSRVLNAIYKEGAVAQKMSWLGFYKAPALDGTILRQTLVAAGTTLARESSGSLTPLLSGRTKDLFHVSDMQDRFLYISNYDPDKVGIGDQLVKYDGAVMTNWGVAPPGSEITSIDSFSDAASWTGVNCNLTDQVSTVTGDVTWDGTAVSIDAPDVTKGTFTVTKEVDPWFYVYGDDRDSTKAVPNRVSFFTYLPRGSLTKSLTYPDDQGFATKGPVVSLYVSPDMADTQTNNWQFDFSNGYLREGWNKLNLDFTAGPPGGSQTSAPAGTASGSFYPERDLVRSTRFEFYLQSDLATAENIVLDSYQKVDEGALVAEPFGEGNLTGLYSYKVVYVSKYGQLSNSGPKSVDITADHNLHIDLTRIPVSPDTQVTARRIYRTVGNGSVWLFLDEILDNVTTTYFDFIGDGSLSNETAPQAGDYADDNSIPPKCGILKSWKKTMFMAGDPQNPYTLYYSEDDEPESFPLINALEMDGKITAMYETYAGLVIETETGKWQIIGDNPDFSVDKVVPNMGCVGRRAAGTARLIGYAVDRDGLRLFDLSETHKISEPIRDKYDTDIDKVNIELIHCVHSKSKNMLLQFNPDSAGEYTSIFCYQYAKDDVTAGYWSTISTPVAAGLNFLDAVEIEDANGDFLIYASGDDGMIYQLFNSASKNWVDADGTTYAIDTKVQIPYLRAGQLGAEVEMATGRVAPHSLELRIGSDDACIWTATVETAEGTTQTLALDSATLSMEFGLNNALIRQRIPNADITPGEYVRLTFQNAEKDVYTRIAAIRFFYHVQPAMFPVTDVDNTIA